MSRIAAALRRAGRTRGIAQAAAEIKAELRKPQLHQPLLVENAMGKNVLALLAVLDTACVNVDELAQASAALFQQHPDYAIITSFPGLADSTGARVLGEIGDDRNRFADARALKAYAGSAPITRASGRSIRYCQDLWMGPFQVTSALVDPPASAGLMRIGVLFAVAQDGGPAELADLVPPNGSLSEDISGADGRFAHSVESVVAHGDLIR